MTKVKKMNKFVVWGLLFICLLIALFGVKSDLAIAENIVYSNVLEDLQKDENFKTEAFPLIENNNSLQVIQIAESENKELFVYVYQPSADIQDLRATTLRISFSGEEDVNPEDKQLEFLNSNGVFYKYKLKDFQVCDDDVRYYNVTAIHRKFNPAFDKESGNDNQISEVAFEVGKLWTACSVDNDVYYYCTDIDVVKIVGKWCGFIRYENDWYYVKKNTDRWFVAFKTDHLIENLSEAEVSYVYRTYKNSSLGEMAEDDLGNSREYDQVEPIPDKKNILGEKVTTSAGGLFKHKYTWNRIETVNEFVKENTKFKDNPNIKDMDFVLSFVETDFTVRGNSELTSRVYGTEIEEVSILKLKFETEGIVYTLGVVDNKQSPDHIPDDIKGGLKWWHKLLIALFALLVLPLVVIFFPVVLSVLCWVFKIIFKCIILLFKGLWWLVTAPFTLFKG